MSQSTSDTQQQLHVIIVGGGICGMACGAALRGHARVTILESVKIVREIGGESQSSKQYHLVRDEFLIHASLTSSRRPFGPKCHPYHQEHGRRPQQVRCSQRQNVQDVRSRR